MEREGLEIMDWTEGHSNCRVRREENSNPGAERFRDVAEKTGKAENLTETGLKGWDRVSATALA